MFDQDTFGDRLKFLRSREDKSPEEIAELLNLSTEQLHKLENGSLNASLDFLVKLAGYFQVSTDYLLGLTDIPHLEQRASD